MFRQVTRQLFGNRGLVTRIMRANYVSEVDPDSEVREFRREPTVNTVDLLGRVGTTPEVIETNSKFITFRMVTNAAGTADWHQINLNFNSGGEFVANNVNVGDRVYVRGRLGYQVKPDNVKYPKIFANQVILVSRSRRRQQEIDESS